jgi:hypothetical protein
MMFLQRAMHNNLGIEDIAAVHASPHDTLTQVNTGQHIVSISQQQPMTTLTVHSALLVVYTAYCP